MPLFPSSIDYTDKDFDALKARLDQLTRSVFPTWTDKNVANFGNILLECFAHVGDVLTFYQDNQASESRFATAKQRRNMIAMAKLIGFTPEGATAETVDVTITARDQATGNPPIGNVSFPVGTIVSTAEVASPIRFQLLSVAAISAGADPSTVSVTAENSENAQDVFESNDTPNQEFILGEFPYLDGSAGITAADGAYTEVDDFLSSTSVDRHFTITVNENDEATIRFGNGTSGKIPVGTITIAYKTGGGEVDVEAGAINQIPGQFTDSLGNPLTVTVTNPAASSGGQERQGVEQIRIAAPRSIQVVNRSVARPDFEIVAEAVPGVARALMLSSDESALIAENSGSLFVIPEGGGVPSQALKDSVAAQFAKGGPFPSLITFEVLVQDPVFLAMNIVAKVFFSEGTDPTVGAAAIRANLTEFFALNVTNDEGETVRNDNVDFGFNFKNVDGDAAAEIPLSTLMNVVRDTTGVRKIGPNNGDFTVNGVHDDTELDLFQFPQLGTVTIIDGDTGGFL